MATFPQNNLLFEKLGIGWGDIITRIETNA
jgi:hypothetical protein